MKKLLFAVTTDLNHDQRMQRICTSLAQLGYEVELVGRQKHSSEPLVQRIFKQHRIQCKYNKGKLFYLEYMLRLYFFIAPRRYDALCAIDLDTALPVFFQARKQKLPFIYDAHEYFPEVIEVTDRKMVKAIWTAIEKYIVTRTKFAYTVTQSIADIFNQKYKTPFDVVRNVPVQREVTTLKKEPNTILYQGAVNEGRGLEHLLEAMINLDAHLIICGDGDVLGNLKKQAKALGISHKVEFKGQVLPEDLQEITRKCQVGVMLLENRGLSYYYSLANKFFDYVHAGVPQLVIDFPEYKQLNDKYEVGLLTSLDVREIEQKLNRLLTDKPLYQKLEANCEIAKKELNWQLEEQKLHRFYEKIWQV